MSDWAAIVTGVAVGVVSLGLLILIFRIIFNTLKEKVNKETFEEFSKENLKSVDGKAEKDVFEECIRRLDDQLESGKRQFIKTDQTLEKINISVQGLREATVGLRESVNNLSKRNNISIKGGM